MQGVVSVQFLAAFNRFLGGDKEISRSVMNESFHNLSWQALMKDNDSIQVKFEAVTELVKNINYLIQQNIYNNKKNSMKINKEIASELIAKEPETIKTDNEKN